MIRRGESPSSFGHPHGAIISLLLFIAQLRSRKIFESYFRLKCLYIKMWLNQLQNSDDIGPRATEPHPRPLPTLSYLVTANSARTENGTHPR